MDIIRFPGTNTRMLGLIVGLLAASAAGFGCATVRPSAFMRALASETFQPDPAELLRLLDERLFRVREFKLIREWARTRGVRVYLAGGTASGAAHYVLEDAEREWLDSRRLPQKYSAYRFQYHYYDIYRSTQDADLVIDGSEADAQAMENFLREKLNYLQGSKSVWEVRLLRQSRGAGAGEKEALLGNPNFLNQNSDSHSTGLVELTDPPGGEGRVRDLFEWENKQDPRFLRDVLAGRLHFYRNPRHNQTARFLKGWNPEIVSVLRYFTKAFQYGLAVDPADEPVLREIIRAFDPADPGLSAQAKKYITANAAKILLHAEDIEAASTALNTFELREKLARVAADTGSSTLATILKRQPLRSYPLGQGPGVIGKRGTGKTAAELKIDAVAHETRDFSAYESMTRSRSGKPNVYQSIDGNAGESAMHGDGFYTRVGKVGARGTGITVRYKIAPDAVDGRDFLKVGDFLIFVNGNALRTIDESFALGPLELMDLIEDQALDQNDRGFFEKLRLRFSTLTATDAERATMQKRFRDWVRKDFLRSKPPAGASTGQAFADVDRERFLMYLDLGLTIDAETAEKILAKVKLKELHYEEKTLVARVIDLADLLHSPSQTRIVDAFTEAGQSETLLKAMFGKNLDFKRLDDQRLFEAIMGKRAVAAKGKFQADGHPLYGFPDLIEDPRFQEYPRWFEFFEDFINSNFTDLRHPEEYLSAIYANPAFQAHPRFVDVTRKALDRLAAVDPRYRRGLDMLLIQGIVQPAVRYNPALHDDPHIRKNYLERLPSLDPFVSGGGGVRPAAGTYPPEVWTLIWPNFDHHFDLIKKEMNGQSARHARRTPMGYTNERLKYLLTEPDFVFSPGGMERAIEVLKLITSRCDVGGIGCMDEHPLSVLVDGKIANHSRWLEYYRAMKKAGVLTMNRANMEDKYAREYAKLLEDLEARVQTLLDAATGKKSAIKTVPVVVPAGVATTPTVNPTVTPSKVRKNGFLEYCRRLLKRHGGS